MKYTVAVASILPWFTSIGAFRVPSRTTTTDVGDPTNPYDLIIIGAGACGLFASGAAHMAGQKCCLIEEFRIGGDCTNAACVPSKALRAIAQRASFGTARHHMDSTIDNVRAREDPDRIGNVTDLYFGSCRFVGTHEVEVISTPLNNTNVSATSTSTPVRLYGKQFLLATGASPVMPNDLQAQATNANLPILTYRSLLNPEETADSKVLQFLEQLETSNSTQNLLIVGGGATACELGSSLAQFESLDISLVAPALLPMEDVRLQEAALNILRQAGVRSFRFNAKVTAILPDKRIQLSDGSILPTAFDAVLLCMGRSPSSLQSLNLETAGIAYTEQDGVIVHPRTLQSISTPHAYAAGDCASAVPIRLRTASQAAWTGFHAVRNAALPQILTVGGRAVHRTVPRIIYTQPEELACVGMTLAECIETFGMDGFDALFCPEEGSDRADMDAPNRDPCLSFVELRATKGGRILGLTACGPTAGEIANTMSLAIANKLTTRDVARSVFGYPSHGYLLHRVALSLALKDIPGLLDACGPVARGFGFVGRQFAFLGRLVRSTRSSKSQWKWESQGCQRALYPNHVTSEDHVRLHSYHAIRGNETLKASVETIAQGYYNIPGSTSSSISKTAAVAFVDWTRAQ